MDKEEFLKIFKGSVEIDPHRRGGQPVLKGTRFPVSQIVSQIMSKAVKDFIDEFDYDDATEKELELFFKCLSFWLINPIKKE